jgi:hypothetical protein
MSVRPFIRMYQRASHWADFQIWGVGWKSVQKLHIWLKSDKNIWHYSKTYETTGVIVAGVIDSP